MGNIRHKIRKMRSSTHLDYIELKLNYHMYKEDNLYTEYNEICMMSDNKTITVNNRDIVFNYKVKKTINNNYILEFFIEDYDGVFTALIDLTNLIGNNIIETVYKEPLNFSIEEKQEYFNINISIGILVIKKDEQNG